MFLTQTTLNPPSLQEEIRRTVLFLAQTTLNRAPLQEEIRRHPFVYAVLRLKGGEIGANRPCGGGGRKKIDIGGKSLDEAKADALEKCNELFDKCEIAIAFRNNCGAVAITSEGDFYATSGSTRDALEKKVLEVCNRRADPRICGLSNIACATE